jgi:hypothetical protein
MLGWAGTGRLAAAAALIGLLLLGFTGAGDTRAAEPQEARRAVQAPTKAAFIAQASVICEETDEQFDDIFSAAYISLQQPSPERLQTALQEAIPVGENHIARLEALTPPAGDEAVIQSYLDGLRTVLEQAREAATTPARSVAFVNSEEQFAESEAIADDYGLVACGSGDAEDAGAAPGAALVQVTATEYAFAMPATVAAGKIAFELDNAGAEEHELWLLMLKAGATIDQALAAGTAGQNPLEFVESVEGTDALPGEQGLVNTELTPGSYAMICTIPAPDGQPHVAKGMVSTFTAG